ncbi:MAG: galactose mutarotase [Chitinophagaceae bacterium]|nr:MAG: galactose mutarotase [Chitinophagaceae bacterium]
MPIRKEQGPSYKGKNIITCTLVNSRGTSIVVTNFGAIIMSLVYPMRNGNKADLVLGFDKADDYLSPDYLGLKANPYFGAVIGRYANRIARGKFSIDGNNYQVDQNLPPEHLHGGREGFDKKVWDLQLLTDTPFPQARFQYISAAGEEGYPGTLVAEVRYELNDNDELTIEYQATTDEPTLFNPTNHSYFNLDGKNGSISEHVLRIPAPVIMEQDEYYTPTGNLLRVDDTMYDFREPKRVGRDWNPSSGYDQSFVVDPDYRYAAAEIFSPASGIRMEVFSTCPMIHFYTGSGIKNIKGKNGEVYEAFAGFSLETQIHPNGINLSNFPDAVLRPGEKFNSKTTYRFTQDPD